jgi:hypothetical protein
MNANVRGFGAEAAEPRQDWDHHDVTGTIFPAVR